MVSKSHFLRQVNTHDVKYSGVYDAGGGVKGLYGKTTAVDVSGSSVETGTA
jgi:hypothetical protein